MKKRLVTAVLMLCLAFSLVACGGNGSDADTQKNNTENSQQDDAQANNDADTESESENVDDGKITYKITVVDEGGNPVAGAMVQLCDDANCMPKITDANGVAEFSAAEFDGYIVKVASAPAGYELITDEYTSLDGATELTLTVKAVQ